MSQFRGKYNICQIGINELMRSIVDDITKDDIFIFILYSNVRTLFGRSGPVLKYNTFTYFLCVCMYTYAKTSMFVQCAIT